jgi:hypothetical protein
MVAAELRRSMRLQNPTVCDLPSLDARASCGWRRWHSWRVEALLGHYCCKNPKVINIPGQSKSSKVRQFMCHRYTYFPGDERFDPAVSRSTTMDLDTGLLVAILTILLLSMLLHAIDLQAGSDPSQSRHRSLRGDGSTNYRTGAQRPEDPSHQAVPRANWSWPEGIEGLRRGALTDRSR